MRSRISLRRAANAALAPLGFKLERAETNSGFKYRERYALGPEIMDGLDCETRRVINLLHYTKISGTEYSAASYESAYHTVELGDRTILGQRNPSERLYGVPFNFDGASVLDIGCNQGGMLFQVSDRIRSGVGVDYDCRMVNAANRLRAHRGIGHLNFYVFDLEKEDLRLLDNFVAGQKVDIIFLLSVCMWIRNWEAVVLKASRTAEALLFETNGTPKQQDDQVHLLRRTYQAVELIRESSPDDPTQKMRALYLCRN